MRTKEQEGRRAVGLKDSVTGGQEGRGTEGQKHDKTGGQVLKKRSYLTVLLQTFIKVCIRNSEYNQSQIYKI